MLASVASQEWQMLKAVGQFRLHYKGQAQGILESLVATPSLLSRVIESQGQDTEVLFIRDRVQSDTVTKARPFTHMVVFGIGDELWFTSQQI